MDPEQIGNLVQVGGVAFVILLLLLWGLYKLGKLALEKAVIPMAEAHVAHVRELTATQKKLSDGQDALNAKIDTICGFRQTEQEKNGCLAHAA